ncbi:MAG: adenylate/guanylate cyclase domain-containing protein [Planctomycetota bacterium]|nr:adenylate/guanylate cyclase domain-containing protein [Planctomycetota bacterium]
MDPATHPRTQSISRALFQLLVLGILVPAALIWGIGHFTARAAVTELWSELSEEIADHTVERTLRFLETGDTALAYNAAAVVDALVDPADRRAVLRYLLAGLRANPNVTWYSFATEDGAYLSAYRKEGRTRLTWREQEEGGARYRDFVVEDDGSWRAEPEQVKPYDPRTRGWYTAAKASDARVWSKPFLFASGPPGFILSKQALGSDGRVVGVWGVEYEMAYVSEFLAGLEIGTTGRAYLVTAAGEVIGHPEAGTNIAAVEGWISVMQDGKKAIANAADHRDPWLRRAFAAMGSNDAPRTGGAFEEAGETVLLGARGFPPESGLDWRVAIVVPEHEILGQINQNSLYAAAAAVLITIFFLLAGLWYARRRVSRPLKGIARDLARMSRLETDAKPTVVESRLTEVAGMVDARDAMRSGLRSFQKYVPADLVRELMARGDEARLGGEEREMTVMFSDVADFTRISEQLDGPGALVGALGEYLDVMSNAIRLRGGTVDKYIGDAIMAFWGAPVSVPDHALHACEAAWDSQQALRVLRFRWAKEGLPPFRARIGVNTGRMLVGNIGSTDRMNYTVMGDPVNLGSRLEGICKIYGLEIGIGESTWAAARDHFEGRPIDCVEVKGREQAVVFHELLGPKGDVEAERLELGAVYTDAFEAYMARRFEAAQAGFERCLKLAPDDVAARVLADRCAAYRDSPPPDDWSGAVRMSRKK